MLAFMKLSAACRIPQHWLFIYYDWIDISHGQFFKM